MIDELSSELLVVGKSEHHDKQIQDIVTGRLDYSADNLLGKKLFARVLGSPHAHAKIVSIDTSGALALPGVEAVLTYEDESSPLKDTLIYWGQEVAIVAAVDEATAARATRLIDVEYDVLPHIIDPEEAMAPGAPLVGNWPDTNTKTWELLRGDAEAGFAAADVVVEGSVGWTNYFQHMSLESCTGVAYWTGDHLYAWATSQNIHSFRRALSGALNMPHNKIHLISHGSGSGYGDKHFSEWLISAAILARKAGKPVQFAMSRAENFMNRTHQFSQRATIKVGVKDDGTITALETDWYANTYAGTSNRVGGAADTLRYTYVCPDASFKGVTVGTNAPQSGPWRCVAHPQGTYIMEVVMDMVAEKLSMNPLDFRLKNIQPPEAIEQDSGRPLSSNGIRDCLEKVATAIGWSQKWHQPGSSTLPDGRMHGIGITAHVDGHGGLSSAVGAIVNLTRDGTALLEVGITRAGGGTNTAHAHIVAERLGMNYEDVNIGSQGDTDTTSDGGGQGGSTRTITLGAAFLKAADDAREQLFETAADMLEVTPAELDAKEGRIFVMADPSNFKTHKEVSNRNSYTIVGRGYGWKEELRLKPMAGQPIGTRCEVRGVSGAACEVAVDTETGEVEILNFVGAVDIGRAIFRKGAENQIEGGIELEVGEALLYQQILDPLTGATLNLDYLADRVPTTLDLHTDKHQAIIVETLDAVGPYGCKGMGEPCVSSYVAVAQAIYNAIGEWIVDPPIYPQKILKALGKA